MDNSLVRSETSLIRDDLYYWPMITFAVEDTLFKVPRRYFEEHKSIFTDVFSLPAGNDLEAEGSRDDNPIRLESISKVDFQRLLIVMYPENKLLRALKEQEEWISVLKLSTLWEFDHIRDKAITEVSKQWRKSAILDKIALARKCKVSRWLLEGYVELVKQEQPPAENEVDALGYVAVYRIFRLREESYRKALDSARGGYSYSAQRTFDGLESKIKDQFQEELKDARYRDLV